MTPSIGVPTAIAAAFDQSTNLTSEAAVATGTDGAVIQGVVKAGKLRGVTFRGTHEV